MHRCPKCGSTKYIESGRAEGGYDFYASDDKDEMLEIEESGCNSELHDSLRYHPNKYVRCYDCKKRYKPKED